MVERHATSPEIYEASFARNRERLLDYLRRRPSTPKLVLGMDAITINVLGYGSVLARGDEALLILAARTNAQATAALLASRAGEGGPFPFGDGAILLDRPDRVPDIRRTVRSIYLGVLANDADSLYRIASCPEDLLHQANIQTDVFWYEWKLALDRVVSSSPDALDAVQHAISVSEAAVVGAADVVAMGRAEMRLVEAILKGDTSVAAQRLHDLLIQHRAFWSSHDNNNLPDGMLCLPASMAVAIGQRLGVKFDCPSDYIWTPGCV